MTHDPNRDTRAPGKIDPTPRPDMRNTGGGMSMGLILGLLAIVILGGVLFYNMRGDSNVATTNQPAGTQSTTGSSTMTPSTTTPSTTTPSATTPSTTTPPAETTKPTTPAPAQ